MSNLITVTSLNTKIKSLLEATFLQIKVEGEVASFTYHTSGHLYFTLKDSNSSIKCVMWRSSVSKMKFKIEKGLHIVIDGAISVYTPRGEYQFLVSHIEPYGEGSLALAFNQLKNSLEAKGYFDKSRKKKLPKIPKKVALVTAKESAGCYDMLKVIDSRYPLLEVYIVDTLVQGDGALDSISRALRFANSLDVDVVVLSRGGGSVDDLWAFNTKEVADAIYAMDIPTISAIGHEVDVLISDYVADVRASTPTMAMEILLPSREELLYLLSLEEDKFRGVMSKFLEDKISFLHTDEQLYLSNSPYRKLDLFVERFAILEEEYGRVFAYKLKKIEVILSENITTLQQNMNMLFKNISNELSYMEQRYENLNPKDNFKQGYAQVIKDGKISALEDIIVGDMFILEDINTKLSVKVIDKKKI